jgi:FixJ family two-component response regulator
VRSGQRPRTGETLSEDPLTPRAREVVTLIVAGPLATRSPSMVISKKTVERPRENIQEKLDA